MIEYTIVKLRHLLEADEALRRLVRQGLLDRLSRNIDDYKEWDKVITILARNGAKLVFSFDSPIWGNEKKYTAIRAYTTNTPRLDFMAAAQKLSWPLAYVVRGVLSKKPRKITFDYE